MFRASKSEAISCCPLRKTVEAMGGSLTLVAEFPDRKPVVLSGLAESDLHPRPNSRKPVLA